MFYGSKQQPAGDSWKRIVIGLLLIPLGLVMTYQLFAKPMAQVIAARHWMEVPCVITSSGVGISSSRRGGSAYRVNVEFSYEVHGQIFYSDRFQFDRGYTGGYALKEAVAQRYPPDSRAVCYVDPAKPQDAVILRDLTPGLLFGLAPLVFSIAGALMLRGAGDPETRSVPGESQNVMVFVAVAALLDAIVFYAVYWELIPEARLHFIDWNLILFMVPFSLISLVFTLVAISGVWKGWSPESRPARRIRGQESDG